MHLWVVDVSRLNPSAVPLNRLPDSKAYEWMPLAAAAAWPGASDAESRNHCALIEYPEDPSVPLPPPRSVASLVAEERELVHRPEPLPPSVRPWREEYPDLPPPAPLPRLIRYSRGRWRAWVAAAQTLSEPRSFEWRPLPDALNSQLDLHLRPADLGMPVIPEEARSSSSRDTILAAAAVPCKAPTISAFALDGLRELWDRRPPNPAESHLGLGAVSSIPTPSSSAPPPDRRAEASLPPAASLA